jgi:hypothetical protein
MRAALPCLLIWSLLTSVLFAEGTIDYARDVKPLLKKKCGVCHGALRQKSELRLDVGRLILEGGEGGLVVVPAKSSESELIRRVTSKDAFDHMPPEGEGDPLTPAQIALLKSWIDQGAKVPANEKIPPSPLEYWSYQQPKRLTVPTVKNAKWLRRPIDAFIAAQHEQRGLQPSPTADKSVLLRRVYLDLVGVPPTREELHAFLADASDRAYEKVVDRLLDDSRHGQRWARHWMDVWRYSDWHGRRKINNHRNSQRHIWRWRDWIVDSINEDKPYDRMILEMLAGDEIAGDDPDIVRATGYLGRSWYIFNKTVWMQDTVEHLGQSFLGMKFKCCRCHDHKYDPVSQQEYYRMRAFFEPLDFRVDRVPNHTATFRDPEGGGGGKAGEVLQIGLSRAYDATPKAPTYLFIRGNEFKPVKDSALAPGVPKSLGGVPLQIEKVQLSLMAFYPALQPFIEQETLASLKTTVSNAEAELANAQKDLKTAKQVQSGGKQSVQPVIVVQHVGDTDPKTKGYTRSTDGMKGSMSPVKDGDVPAWNIKVTGNSYDLYLSSPFSAEELHNLLTKGWRLTVKLRVVEGGNGADYGDTVQWGTGQKRYHMSYGIDGKGNSEVRLWGLSKTFTIPGTGYHVYELRDDDADGKADLYVDGVLKQTGYEGMASNSFARQLVFGDAEQAAGNSGNSNYAQVTLSGGSAISVSASEAKLAAAERKLKTSRLALHATQARFAADRTKHQHPDAAETKTLAQRAAQTEGELAVAIARDKLHQLRQNVLHAQTALNPQDAKSKKTLAVAQKKMEAAKKQLASARTKLQKANGKYVPVGKVFPTTSTGRRTALAKWIASRQNPRTARVAVNQMWLRHFGEALVRTVNDFGLRGETPSHPKLLDWLAVELMDQGWSMKALHRLMVLSNTYRMQSDIPEAGHPNVVRDSTNTSLWRFNSRRVEAEVVRDSLLHVAGVLDTSPNGPEIDPKLAQTSHRRSLYFLHTPDSRAKFLDLFDNANPEDCYRRRESIVPNQALAMAHSELSIVQSRRASEIVNRTHNQSQGKQSTDPEFVTAAFEQILTRRPLPAEHAACETFLRKQAEFFRQNKQLTVFRAVPAGKLGPSKDPVLRARENLVHVLINHNDFVTIR